MEHLNGLHSTRLALEWCSIPTPPNPLFVSVKRDLEKPPNRNDDWLGCSVLVSRALNEEEVHVNALFHPSPENAATGPYIMDVRVLL